MSIDLSKNFPAINNHQLGFDDNVVEDLLNRYPEEEIIRRLELLNRWMRQANLLNHYGVILTPVLIEHLTHPGDLEPLLNELDRRSAATRAGRFDLDDPIQRDLEFRRFAMESTGDRFPVATAQMYGEFTELSQLPPPSECEFSLSEEQTLAARRIAHEAVGLFEFVVKFKAGTSRPVIVVGNDRYGRLWFVEPIERFLIEAGIEVRYDRVPSLLAHRLSTPAAFPSEFVRRMNTEMPHIIVADGASGAKNPGAMKISKALRSVANWFAAFNDVRAQGDRSKYVDESSIPADFIEQWHEFVVRRRELSAWVTPGPTYRVTTWSHDMFPVAEFGDIPPIPAQHVVFDDDRPQAILANPTMYPGSSEALPEELREVHPYFLNDPEKRVAETIVYGFGAYGFESRVEGPTTAQYIAAAQQVAREEVEKLLSSST